MDYSVVLGKERERETESERETEREKTYCCICHSLGVKE